MAKRTFLHVGTPKSGTSYLQDVVWRSADTLRRLDVLLPGRRSTHYAAAAAVCHRPYQMRDPRADPATAWPSLVEEIECWPATALVSDELFAPATARQAGRALSLLSGEVHVVLTARALHRQVPAAWQEQVKGGYAGSLEEFGEAIRQAADAPLARARHRVIKALGRGSERGAWFWLVQDVADVARRWGGALPVAQVHIVTLPRDSADPAELWRRYAAVLGVDPTAIEATVPRRNVSLGRVEVELLRRVHAARDPRFTDPGRHRWTRRLLAHELLAQRRGDPIPLPPDLAGWLGDRARAMVAALRDAGYAVAGDLADLEAPPALPAAPTGATDADAATVTQAELDEAADWTIGQLHAVLAERGGAGNGPAAGVRPGDGVRGILELLEHIRAADSGRSPRPAGSS